MEINGELETMPCYVVLGIGFGVAIYIFIYFYNERQKKKEGNRGKGPATFTRPTSNARSIGVDDRVDNFGYDTIT